MRSCYESLGTGLRDKSRSSTNIDYITATDGVITAMGTRTLSLANLGYVADIYGSNANGYYIKFGNGTLFCWGTNTSNYSNYTHVFPTSFVDTNYTITFGVTDSSDFVCYDNGEDDGSEGKETDRVDLKLNVAYMFDWQAIGKWK